VLSLQALHCAGAISKRKCTSKKGQGGSLTYSSYVQHFRSGLKLVLVNQKKKFVHTCLQCNLYLHVQQQPPLREACSVIIALVKSNQEDIHVYLSSAVSEGQKETDSFVFCCSANNNFFLKKNNKLNRSKTE